MEIHPCQNGHLPEPSQGGRVGGEEVPFYPWNFFVTGQSLSIRHLRSSPRRYCLTRTIFTGKNVNITNTSCISMSALPFVSASYNYCWSIWSVLLFICQPLFCIYFRLSNNVENNVSDFSNSTYIVPQAVE